MNAELVASIVLGTCLAGFVQGLSGFAFGLVAMGVWAWSIEPRVAAPMVVFGSVVGQVLAFGTIRRSFDTRRVLPFIVGGVLGVPLGAWLLHYVDPRLFRGGVGVFLILYCSAMLMTRHLPVVSGGGFVIDGLVGWIGGVMGGLGGLTLATYVVSGTVTRGMLWIFAIMVPVSILPTLAGARLYRTISTAKFQRLVLTLLLLSGVLLVVSLRH
jgi:uncharacterized protein